MTRAWDGGTSIIIKIILEIPYRVKEIFFEGNRRVKNCFGGNSKVNQIILERTRSKLNYFGGNSRVNGVTSVGTVEKMKLFLRKY